MVGSQPRVPTRGLIGWRAGGVGPAAYGEGMTPALSPSRAADFKQCPLLYRFRVIDRLPSPTSAAAARGTLVHAVLERLFDLPAHERTPAAAAALVAPQWERLVAEPAVRLNLPGRPWVPFADGVFPTPSGKVELYAAIRRDARVEEFSIRELARRHGVHRRTVRQAVTSAVPPPRQGYPARARPAIDPWREVIGGWLIADQTLPHPPRGMSLLPRGVLFFVA